MVHAVFPGSFDPIHNGHLDVVRRAARIIDRLTVAVVDNPLKTNKLFTIEQRLALVTEAVAAVDNVQTERFEGLLVDFIDKVGANVIIKSLRTVSDFEVELQMAHLNRQLNPDIETAFIVTASRWSYVSSTRIREIAGLGGDVSTMVPGGSLRVLREKFRKSIGS